jgi:hypothetical protein
MRDADKVILYTNTLKARGKIMLSTANAEIFRRAPQMIPVRFSPHRTRSDLVRVTRIVEPVRL